MQQRVRFLQTKESKRLKNCQSIQIKRTSNHSSGGDCGGFPLMSTEGLIERIFGIVMREKWRPWTVSESVLLVQGRFRSSKHTDSSLKQTGVLRYQLEFTW
jgi:hypothetical protein